MAPHDPTKKAPTTYLLDATARLNKAKSIRGTDARLIMRPPGKFASNHCFLIQDRTLLR